MATPTEAFASRRSDREVHAKLIQEAKDAISAKQAWLYLESAHVVGQLVLRLHLQTHAHMLKLSWRTRDWPEALGQVLRLALVPLGHLFGRLPLGNPGRATVSAFAPMPVRPELAALIAGAQDCLP